MASKRHTVEGPVAKLRQVDVLLALGKPVLERCSDGVLLLLA
jgi:hypothetical protein